MAECTTFRIQPFDEDLRQTDAPDEAYLPFVIRHPLPMRFISWTRRFSLHAPQQRIDVQIRRMRARQQAVAHLAPLLLPGDAAVAPGELLATLPPLVREELAGVLRRDPLATTDPARWRAAVAALKQSGWRLSWLGEYRQEYAKLMDTTALRGLDHYLLSWPTSGMRPDELIPAIGQVFGTGAHQQPLPSMLPGVYHEHARWLAPDDLSHPYVTFLMAQRLRGTWTTDVLHRLFWLDCDVALAVDVQPLSRLAAQYVLQNADAEHRYQSTRTMRASDGRDVRAERRGTSAHELQDLVYDGQHLHDLRVVIAVFGNDAPALASNVAIIESALGGTMQLVRPPHGQGPLSRVFSTSTIAELDLPPIPAQRRPSHAVAAAIPWGTRKPSRDDGIIWMTSNDSPIMFNPWTRKKPGHAVIAGKTGSGKTFAMMVLALRAMVEVGARVVLFEPQGHGARLVRACRDGGVHYRLNTDQCVNVLDVVAGRSETGAPPSMTEQVGHVVSQLSVLLGQTRMGGDGRALFVPHSFSAIERGELGLAIVSVYGETPLDTITTQDAPILADLCTMLANQQNAEALGLARLISTRLVTSAEGRMFNGHSTVTWDFTAPCTYYDFSEIPDGELRIFYYAQAFGSLNRYVRSKQRDTTAPLISIIDEFAYMAQVPSLAAFAATASKTWRTFGASIWTMDQDAHTYLGTENGTPDGNMLTIFLNSAIKLIFRQDKADALRLTTKIQGLHGGHAQAITNFTQGQALLIWDDDSTGQQHNEVYIGNVIATDAEKRELAGT